jgi:hypothetical protein
MSIRTLNYTNRRRIIREDARITIREEKGAFVFDAGLSLADYGLPGVARIFIEAYRQTQYMRFDFGQVGAMRIPEDRFLSDFDSVEGVLFRVKVVTSADPRGLLLAEADQIRPRKLTDEDENRIPLLPVTRSDNMGDEIWRLEFDDQQTLLKVNAELGDWQALARAPVFIALVYPAVFRAVLWRILGQENHRDTEDTDDWRSRWLRFAVGLPGVGDPPVQDDEAKLDDWIDGAASAFARRHNIRAAYERYWTGAQEQ